MTYSWPAADAWLLLAVREARSDAALAVLRAADSINHVLIAEDELDGALRRMTAARFLEVEGDRIALTVAGRELMDCMEGGGWYEVWPRLEEALAALPTPDETVGESLAPGAYAAAAAEYGKRS